MVKSPQEPQTLTCFIHCRPETQTLESYRACGECWHVYQTAEDLIDEYAKTMLEIGSPIIGEVDPMKIWTCPLCAHDF